MGVSSIQAVSVDNGIVRSAKVSNVWLDVGFSMHEL